MIVRSHGTSEHHRKIPRNDKNDKNNKRERDKRDAEKRDEAQGKITYQESYTITVNKKTKANRFIKSGSRNCFYINGVEAPRIILQRGVYYRFINESDEPFYFTTDSEGGNILTNDDGEKEAIGNLSKNTKGFKGMAKGTIYFMVSDDLPDQFYYQSSNEKNMGSGISLSELD